MRTNYQDSEEFNRLFWSKVTRHGQDDCWPWTGSIVNRYKSYGRIRIERKLKLTHRVAYELSNKIIVPDNIQVLHTCDNPICCNPNHLKLGTNKDNMLDKTNKNRQSTSGGPEGKFTYEEWQDIKNLHSRGWNNTDIGRNYQTYDTTIRRVLAAGESYRYKR